MKKWVIALSITVIILICLSYLLIPNTIKLHSSSGVNATSQGIHRVLLDKQNVAKWWPGKISSDGFTLNDRPYKIENGNTTLLQITINGESSPVTTGLFLISIIIDSTQLEWTGSMVMPYNPVKRFLAYRESKEISKDMNSILKSLQTFYSKPENIYGVNIQKAYVADSFLIATAGQVKGYPTNQYIYGLVDQLKQYASSNSAKQSGYPMLNIETRDSINFDVRVAIPTDKLLPSSGNMLQKKMLGRGYILMAEVKGGVATTLQAFQQLQNFLNDYQYRAPAIPFYSLITDRSMEQDSSKWITKIYFPVM
ncbi:MAG: GyrI-like domain-containing protein [Bacteroidota bacterium]